MPFLKEFIINEKTKIKLWKVMLGELSSKELNKDDKKLSLNNFSKTDLLSRLLFFIVPK